MLNAYRDLPPKVHNKIQLGALDLLGCSGHDDGLGHSTVSIL